MALPRKPKEAAESCRLRMKGAGGGGGGAGRRTRWRGGWKQGRSQETTAAAPGHRALRVLSRSRLSAQAPELAMPQGPHTLPSTLLVAQRSNREQDGPSALSWSKST